MATSNIANKVVVITGASGGIGEATARLLAGNGAKVVLGARRKDRIDALVHEITARGGSALGFQTDVTKRSDVEALVQGAVNQHGRLDVIVNNAGIMPIAPTWRPAPPGSPAPHLQRTHAHRAESHRGA